MMYHLHVLAFLLVGTALGGIVYMGKFEELPVTNVVVQWVILVVYGLLFSTVLCCRRVFPANLIFMMAVGYFVSFVVGFVVASNIALLPGVK